MLISNFGLAAWMLLQPPPSGASAEAPESSSTSAETLVSFGEEEICLSEDEQREVVEALRSRADASATVVLVAYSDASEFKWGSQGPKTTCLPPELKLPRDLKRHIKMAVSRALHVYSLARDEGIPGFDREFAIIWSPEEVDALHGERVLIQPRRSEGTNAEDRRLDLVLVEPERIVQEDSLKPDDEGVPPIRYELTVDLSRTIPAPVQPPPRRSAKIASLSLLVAGVTGVGMATGFFAASAAQFQSARDTVGMEATSLREDGRRYAVGASVALGVGLGAAVAGIITFAVVKRREGGSSPSGLAFRQRPGGR